MAGNFNDLLSTPLDDVEKPKPLPSGTYYGLVTSYKLDESSKKKTAYVRFSVQLQSPGDDVDLEGLAEATKHTPLEKKSLSKDFYLTPSSLYRIKDFLSSLGIMVEGRQLGETLPESTNARVICQVIQRNSEDLQEIYNEIKDITGQD